MHEKDSEESAQETSQESKGGTPGEMLLGTGEEKDKKKTAELAVCERQLHRGQGKIAKGIAEALSRSVH